MSRSLHATSTETETETTTIINNKMESSVVASNNIANNNKKHASMSSSQIPVLSKVRSLKNLSCFSWRLYFLLYAKGQLILKTNCQAANCFKNEQIHFISMQRVFVRFLEEIEDSKREFQKSDL